MPKRTRRWWNVLGKMWDAMIDFVEESVPTESSLRSDLRSMYDALEARADATSLSMTLADQKRTELEIELSNFTSLERSAEQFVDDSVKLRRLAALLLQSKRRIETLKTEYASLQKQAEIQVKGFLDKKGEVKTREAELPRLEQDLELIRVEEHIQKLESQFDFEGADQSFERTRREIEARKLSLTNKALLAADPNADLDREIRQALGEQEVEQEMEALQKKIRDDQGIIDIDAVEVVDPVVSARQALEAPRYAGLLRPVILKERKVEPILLKRLPERTKASDS